MSQTDGSYSYRLQQYNVCVCVCVTLCVCSNQILTPSTDAPRGFVRLCAVPDALEPAAETGPAAHQPSHQLDHVR